MNKTHHRAFKHDLYEQFSRLTGALASPRRLELIDLLAQGERSVEDLAHELNMSAANTSQHLQILKAAQLVTSRREGLYVFYRLTSHQVFKVWQALRDLAQQQLADIERVVHQYLTERSRLEAVGLEELHARLEQGGVTVLDVRPAAEFKAGHLPGARSVPLNELEARLGELPASQEIIAYCRGPYCVFADEAVELLRSHGFEARRLEQGLPDWRAAGWPVEV